MKKLALLLLFLSAVGMSRAEEPGPAQEVRQFLRDYKALFVAGEYEKALQMRDANFHAISYEKGKKIETRRTKEEMMEIFQVMEKHWVPIELKSAVTKVETLNDGWIKAVSTDTSRFLIDGVPMQTERVITRIFVRVDSVLKLEREGGLPAVQIPLTNEIERDGADQPATAPESSLEGGDKPQPESEGRSG